MQVIDGKALAKRIIEGLAAKPRLKKFLGAAVVGDSPASLSFLKRKEEAARAAGIDFRLYRFPAGATGDDLRKEIGKIAGHKTCGGFLIQLPLPEGLNRQYAANAIPPEKDVDLLGERAQGAFYSGRSKILPPAVLTVEEILRQVGWDPKNLRVAVVGLGVLVGTPAAHWAMRRSKEAQLFHKGSDLKGLKDADLVIVGVGKSRLIRPDMLKDGAGVIDFGYSEAEDESGKMRLAGDFDAEVLTSESRLAFYTPTPGGTGPILVAKLLENFYDLASAA